jgi:hypothetical protein
MSTIHASAPTATTTAVPLPRWRRAAFVGIPAIWIVVALIHPVANVGSIYEDLSDDVNVWIGVHLAQLVLAAGLGSILWVAVRGHRGTSATLTRIAVPVYLVFFAAFDAVTGIASGLALHHASSLSGAEQAGAASTVEYLANNRITADVSPVWALGQTAMVVALLGTAVTFRRAGGSRATWVSGMVGALAVMHAGPPAAVGFAALGFALRSADREGLVR